MKNIFNPFSGRPEIISGGFITKKITLTSAQILSLFTTPILAIPSPGAGKWIEPIRATYKLTYNSVVYAGSTGLVLIESADGKATTGQAIFNVSSGSTSPLTRPFDATGAFAVLANSGATLQNYQEDKGIWISGVTADPTAGNSSLTIWITYFIQNIT